MGAQPFPFRVLLLFVSFSVSSAVVIAQEEIPHASESTAASSDTKAMEPIPTESRRLSLETAGAFVNDGFRIRDGEWSGKLSPGVPMVLQVTLFAGENYWFVAASQENRIPLRITVYDATGKPMKGLTWHDSFQEKGERSGSRSAAGIVPTHSGKYYVGVEFVENSATPNGPVDFSMVYCYK